MIEYNSSIPWSKDSNYVIRCLAANFAPSKAGNPMLAFEYEVVAPTEMESGSDKVNIAGVKLRTWQVCQTLEDGVVNEEKSAKNKEALAKLYTAFGITTELNVENPDSQAFVGKCVYALLYDEETEQRKSPTAEQLKAGQRQGDIMYNPVTKQPLKRHAPKIGEIYGLAPVGGSVGV